ncbi:MAG TPA: outer membrane beta-barrel protein, partial [Verrucomicrobiae bacterium]|nr:outer membrane beta-barrel protein [Verrucomicrobiae bacterium]
MKLNKWTVALAALGLVSLTTTGMADESETPLQTALSSTTLSGYVDTSAQWNFGTGNAFAPPYKFGGADKADGFNLNVIQLRIERPLDEQEWAAGYRVDLWAGPDANTLGTQSILSQANSDFAIRQAYIALRMPIANGIDWKVGVFDSIIGYESVEDPSNPNYTRSYGHSIEPQTHTGILASYRVNDLLSFSLGIADTSSSVINARSQQGSLGYTGGALAPLFNGLYDAAGFDVSDASGFNPRAESYKTYMGSVALTAPDSMGFLAGSTIYAGAVHGYNNSVLGSGIGDVQDNYYFGATLATPVTGL